KAILALGKIAWEAYLEILKQDGKIASRAAYKFAHGAEMEMGHNLPRLFGGSAKETLSLLFLMGQPRLKGKGTGALGALSLLCGEDWSPYAQHAEEFSM